MEKLIYLTTNPNKVNEANEFFGKKYGRSEEHTSELQSRI